MKLDISTLIQPKNQIPSRWKEFLDSLTAEDAQADVESDDDDSESTTSSSATVASNSAASVASSTTKSTRAGTLLNFW